ncbi:MAG: hypothetical protein WCT49_06325 [Candidatus Paceibacterota bacterium]|jgi:hypothetical protein|nr:hypothetical protein [Candidatus Paceibacterota bacterium]
MHFAIGKVYRIDFCSGTIQESRTKENAYKKPHELKYDFFASEVRFVDCKFDDLSEGDTVLFSLTHYDGDMVIDTVKVPVYDDE